MKTTQTQTISHIPAHASFIYTLSFPSAEISDPRVYNAATLVRERVIAWYVETCDVYEDGCILTSHTETRPITYSGNTQGLHAIYDSEIQTFYIGEVFATGDEDVLLSEMRRLHAEQYEVA